MGLMYSMINVLHCPGHGKNISGHYSLVCQGWFLKIFLAKGEGF